jgi:hypothetical protein
MTSKPFKEVGFAVVNIVSVNFADILGKMVAIGALHKEALERALNVTKVKTSGT